MIVFLGDRPGSGHNVDFILASKSLELQAVIVSKDNIFSKIQEFEQELQVENWAI